jgi:regulator of protease activity HflC (stomatin/prohibitin superfamily)
MRMRHWVALSATAMLLAGCGQSIDAGEVGLKKHFGAIEGDPIQAGWVWYNPFSTDVITMNTRALKWVGQKSTSTHDVQQADVMFAVTYRIDPLYAKQVYQTYGREWAARVLPQIVFNSIGDEFGKWDAVRIIEQRDKVQHNIYARIQPRLTPAHIQLISFDLMKVSYNQAFMDSVEQKQIAIQRAIEEQNHTVQIREQAAQKVLTAEADARSIQLQAQALESNPRLVEYEAVKRWDGKLPENMYGGGAVPFINVAPGAGK